MQSIKSELPRFTPGLAIVQVGDRADSNVYIGQKLKIAAELGINAQHIKIASDAAEATILDAVRKLNDDLAVHGIIVQVCSCLLSRFL